MSGDVTIRPGGSEFDSHMHDKSKESEKAKDLKVAAADPSFEVTSRILTPKKDAVKLTSSAQSGKVFISEEDKLPNSVAKTTLKVSHFVLAKQIGLRVLAAVTVLPLLIGVLSSHRFREWFIKPFTEPKLLIGGVPFYDIDLKLDALRHELALTPLKTLEDGGFDMSVADDKGDLAAQKFHLIKEMTKEKFGISENDSVFPAALQAELEKYNNVNPVSEEYRALIALMEESGRDYDIHEFLGTEGAHTSHAFDVAYRVFKLMGGVNNRKGVFNTKEEVLNWIDAARVNRVQEDTDYFKSQIVIGANILAAATVTVDSRLKSLKDNLMRVNAKILSKKQETIEYTSFIEADLDKLEKDIKEKKLSPADIHKEISRLENLFPDILDEIGEASDPRDKLQETLVNLDKAIETCKEDTKKRALLELRTESRKIKKELELLSVLARIPILPRIPTPEPTIAVLPITDQSTISSGSDAKAYYALQDRLKTIQAGSLREPSRAPGPRGQEPVRFDVPLLKSNSIGPVLLEAGNALLSEFNASRDLVALRKGYTLFTQRFIETMAEDWGDKDKEELRLMYGSFVDELYSAIILQSEALDDAGEELEISEMLKFRIALFNDRNFIREGNLKGLQDSYQKESEASYHKEIEAKRLRESSIQTRPPVGSPLTPVQVQALKTLSRIEANIGKLPSPGYLVKRNDNISTSRTPPTKDEEVDTRDLVAYLKSESGNVLMSVKGKLDEGGFFLEQNQMLYKFVIRLLKIHQQEISKHLDLYKDSLSPDQRAFLMTRLKEIKTILPQVEAALQVGEKIGSLREVARKEGPFLRIKGQVGLKQTQEPDLYTMMGLQVSSKDVGSRHQKHISFNQFKRYIDKEFYLAYAKWKVELLLDLDPDLALDDTMISDKKRSIEEKIKECVSYLNFVSDKLAKPDLSDEDRKNYTLELRNLERTIESLTLNAKQFDDKQKKNIPNG
jgi:hypothetical protein